MRVRLLTGLRFGRLTVLEKIGSDGKRVRWKVSCDCGAIRACQAGNLMSGHTQSCGCLRAERTRAARLTHGHSVNYSRSPEYKSWQCMKERCLTRTNESFDNYGGRGISVCKRWLESFAHFYADMGRRPPRTSIERVNNNGNYEPGNCIWATQKVQTNNTRRNVNISFDGKTMTVSQWAELLGVKPAVIARRIRRGDNPSEIFKDIQKQ